MHELLVLVLWRNEEEEDDSPSPIRLAPFDDGALNFGITFLVLVDIDDSGDDDGGGGGGRIVGTSFVSEKALEKKFAGTDEPRSTGFGFVANKSKCGSCSLISNAH